MKFDPLAKILSAIIAVLLIPSGIILAQDIKNKPVIQEEKKGVFTFHESIRFEVNVEEIDPMSYLEQIVDLEKSEYDEIISIMLQLDHVGEKRGIVRYIQNGFRMEKNFPYEVYDEQAPIISQSELFSTRVGEPIDFYDYLSVSDNSLKEGESIPIEIEGYVNFDVAGYYYIIISATDASGNSTFYEAEVEILAPIYVPPVEEVTPTPPEVETPVEDDPVIEEPDDESTDGDEQENPA